MPLNDLALHGIQGLIFYSLVINSLVLAAAVPRSNLLFDFIKINESKNIETLE